MDTTTSPVVVGAVPNAAQAPQPVSSVPPPSPVNPSVSQKKSPSNMGLWIIIVLVVLIVLGVGAYAIMSKPSTNMTTIPETITPTLKMEQVSTPAIPSMEAQTGSLTDGETDDDLEKDSSTLNAELDSMNMQLDTIDTTLNDQPGDLSE